MISIGKQCVSYNHKWLQFFFISINMYYHFNMTGTGKLW